ncbi:MAG: sulfotransferase domain-containing protein [Bacteroidota bacterium]
MEKLPFLSRIKEYRKLQKIKATESGKNLIHDFHGKVMCLFASPRGGSTWLLETLSSRCDFVPINEPLFQGKLRVDGIMPSFTTGRPYLKDLNFWFHQPLDESYNSDREKEIFRKIFSGRHLHPDLTRYSSISELKTAEKFLVKFCYGNLMLPWIVKNFNVAAIFLIRHPCAVIASQLSVKGAFDHIINYPGFTLPVFFNAEYFDQFDSILSKSVRPEEILAAIWSITIKHVIDHPKNNTEWHTLRYEDLLNDPFHELKKIENRYPEFGWSKNTSHNYVLPSKSTLDKNLGSHLLDGTQETKWKDQLTHDQIKNIFSIVKDFGIEIYEP